MREIFEVTHNISVGNACGEHTQEYLLRNENGKVNIEF